MELNKENMKKIILLISFTILLYIGLSNIDSVLGVGGKFIGVIWPFIIGGIIAFIINVPMSYFEKKIFKAEKISTKSRTVSILLTLFVIGIISALVLFLIVPELITTFSKLIDRLPSFFKKSLELFTRISNDYPFLKNIINKLEIDLDSINKQLFKFIKESSVSMISSGFTVAQSVVSGVINSIIAFIFALYILFQKETLSRQAKMILTVVFPKRHSDRINRICTLSNKIFKSFLSGQFLEAIILGSIFLAVLLIGRFPYAMLISLVISVTALVPIVGTFVGCMTGIFLILTEDPRKALIFIIVFLVVQQIEGNFIYPKVVGGSVGLPSIWVLVAVIIGGSLFGIMGIVLFIPIFSILYTLIRESVYNIINRENIPKEKRETDAGKK